MSCARFDYEVLPSDQDGAVASFGTGGPSGVGGGSDSSSTDSGAAGAEPADSSTDGAVGSVGGSGTVGGTGGAATGGTGGAATGGSGGASAGGAGGASTGGSGGASTGGTGGGPCEWTEFSTPETLSGLGFGDLMWGPALSADGSTLYFSVGAGNNEDLYVATRADRSAQFSAGTPVQELNSAFLDSTPSLSADGLVMHFASTRTGTQGARDLMVATRPDTGSSFEPPSWMSELNTAGTEMSPDLTSDLLTIVYMSDGDLWIAERTAAELPFDAPSKLDEVSSTADESGVALSSDGLVLYFSSARAGGFGLRDIWVATRSDRSSAFGVPVHVPELGHAATELDPELSNDGTEIFFSSDRSGAQLLYRATRECL